MNISFDGIEMIQMVIDRINVQSKVISVSIDPSGVYTLGLCSIKWATVSDTVTVNNIDCTVKSIDYINRTITVKPKSTVSISLNDIVNFKRPQFMYGTKLSTSNEYSRKSDDSRKKLPLLWLHEPTMKTRYLSPDSGTEKEVTYDLFFLDDYELDKSTNENNYRTTVKPMIVLCDLFIRTISNMYGIFNIVESKSSEIFLRFGNEKNNNDNYYFESVIADNLSGVKLSITIPLIRQYDNSICNC